MSDEESLDSVHEQTVPTEHQDERLTRLPPQAVLSRAPVPPTAAEKRQIRAATSTVAAKPSPVEVRVGQDAQCRSILGPPHTDEAGWLPQMRASFGTPSGAFVEAGFGRHEVNPLVFEAKSRDLSVLQMHSSGAMLIVWSAPTLYLLLTTILALAAQTSRPP